MSDKKKISCLNCGTKFFLIKNPLKKCPKCGHINTEDAKDIKLPVQVFYYDDRNKKEDILSSNFKLNIKGLDKSGWYFLPSNAESIKENNFVRLGSFPKKGLVSYLSSFFFPSVGEETAKTIADSSLINIFLQNTELDKVVLKENLLLTDKTINIICKVWKNKKLDNVLHILLRELGIGHAASNDIVNNRSESIIELLNSPYSLLGTVPYFTLINAENIIKNLSLDISEKQKIEGILEYSIKEIEKRYGHTSFYKNVVFKKFNEFFPIDQNKLNTFVQDSKNFLITTENNKEIITNRFSHDRDQLIANKLKAIQNKKTKKTKVKDISSIGKDFIINVEQTEAIKMALNERLIVITGGPGTGKTTVISAISKELKNKNINFALTALTGKAARRMSEIEGLQDVETSTIHLLLVKAEANFKPNPIDQTLIIDESSMLDITLMHKLVKYMDENTRLIFVGDVDQLPPISPGQVFKDLIDSKKIPTIQLVDNFRQIDGKQIVINANKIIRGITPNLEDDLSQFEFIEENNEHRALELVLENYLSLYKGSEDFCTHTQILIPMKKGILGSFNINKTIQKSMNRKTELLKKNDDVMIYQGDTVIQTRNNYKLGVINGDIGQVIDQEIEGKKKSIIVNINGYAHVYEGKDIFDIDPAYALTIHRSQGSEYENVIIPISNHHEFMLDPKLLYTAVTRAKKKVFLIGNKQSFINGLRANWKYDRLTFLDKVIEDTF